MSGIGDLFMLLFRIVWIATVGIFLGIPIAALGSLTFLVDDGAMLNTGIEIATGEIIQ
jgi:hypothetical protein